MTRRVSFTAIALGAVAFLAVPPQSVQAQMGPPSTFEERTTQTGSFSIKIRMGSKVTMPMSSMTVTDQGNPVNRHLEVYIFSKSSGAEVKDMVPTVKVTNQATGASRQLANMTACRIAKHRETEPHFGDNIYLPDGTYTITVVVGKETAVFKDLILKASQ